MNESPFLTYSSSAFSRRLTFNHNNRTFEQQSLHPLCSSNRASSFTFQPLPAPPSRDTISTEQYRHWLDRKIPDSTTPLYVSSSLLLQIKRRRRGGRKLERFEHSAPLPHCVQCCGLLQHHTLSGVRLLGYSRRTACGEKE